MTNTADLLGISTDELEQARRSGKTLSDLASEKGVSKDDLVKSISQDLKANKPDGAAELSDTQLTEMATNIADGKRPQGPPPGRRAHGEDRSQSNIASLADELGVKQSDLLDALNSDGFDVSSLLKQSNYSSSGSASGLAIDYTA
jgi:uncharacterized protein YidB (DUF937 family)